MTRLAQTAPSPREPTLWLVLTLLVMAWSVHSDQLFLAWFAEAIWVVLGLPILVTTSGRCPLSSVSYRLLASFALVILVGAHYTYALVPLGEWARGWLRLVAVSLWLAAPVIVGGGLHIALIKRDVLPALAVPIDGGRQLRGRPLFGRNKTLRGVIAMPLLTAGCAWAQAAIADHSDWARALTLPGVASLSPLAWGALLGAGYVLGELPNSALKRQLDIAPGAAGRGWLGPVFWLADQVDSLAGTLAAMACVVVPPWPIVVTLTAITLIVHPAAAAVMVGLGLKERVG